MMRHLGLALRTTLILLGIGPFAAAAQDANAVYRETMDKATMKRTVDPVRPGDEAYGCEQIRAELSDLNGQINGDMRAIRKPIEAESAAKPGELAAAAAVRKVRDIANFASPMGMALGNPIEDAYRATVEAREGIRQHDYLLLALKSAKDFNFIAARIPYLHTLARQRCKPEEYEAIRRDAASAAGPSPRPAPPGPQKSMTRIEADLGAIVGGAVRGTGTRP